MKGFLKEHRLTVLVLILCIALIAAVSAVLCTKQINSRATATADDTTVVNDRGVFPDDVVIHHSGDGEIVLAASAEPDMLSTEASPLRTISDPEKIWTDGTAYAGNHTPVTEAKMKDGSIGILTIPKLQLSANVYESEDSMEAMSKGIAHFPSTSAFDGNVGVSAHNVNFDGSDGYFKDLHTLKEGDIVKLKTGLGEREYTVTLIKTIDASDWSPLNHADHNMVTLITCISGQPSKRLCVQAAAK